MTRGTCATPCRRSDNDSLCTTWLARAQTPVVRLIRHFNCPVTRTRPESLWYRLGVLRGATDPGQGPEIATSLKLGASMTYPVSVPGNEPEREAL